MISITKEQARRFLLMYHGLWPSFEFKGKKGIVDYIRRVGCIQFDPLNIAGFNHELVLQARIKDFKPAMLQELLYKDHSLLDGWDKNMSIYSMADWPCFSRSREAYTQRLLGNPQIATVAPKIEDEISIRGPLSSSDIEHNQIVDWSWAPTSLSRAALESLYFSGRLCIHHKNHTRRFYDLAERMIPREIFNCEDPNKTQEAHEDWLVLRRIGGIGLLWNRAGDGWLGISNLKSTHRSNAISRLQDAGKLIEVTVEGVTSPLYMKSDYQDMLSEAMNCDKPSNRAFIMAPLDNLLWERKLLMLLFGFDYRWEVYKPQDERKYGYYVLPVLYDDRFVARFEPGRDKKSNALIIKNWWWEPGVKVTKKMETAVYKCFEQFKGFLGVDEVKDMTKVILKI